MTTTNRKALPVCKCNYQCCDCGNTIAAMPYAMEDRNYCSACGGTMWQFKGIRDKGEYNGCGNDKVIDSTFHRKLTGKAKTP